jgi:hypothetical protein
LLPHTDALLLLPEGWLPWNCPAADQLLLLLLLLSSRAGC